jgi:undecaprenyl-phosphate galactose phosphotransferase
MSTEHTSYPNLSSSKPNASERRASARSASLRFLVVLDTLTAVLSVGALFQFRTSDIVVTFSRKAGALFIPEAFAFYALAALLMPLLFRLNNLYKYRVIATSYDQITQIIKSYFNVFIVLLLLLFFFQESEFARSSRGFLVGFTLFGIMFMSVERLIVASLVRRRVFMTDAVEARAALIVGAGHAGETFASMIVNNPELGIERAFFLDDDPQKIGTVVLGFPVLDSINNVHSRAIDVGADEIYIVINAIDRERLLEIIAECKKTGLPVKVMSRHLSIVQRDMYSSSSDDDTSALELASQLTIQPGAITKRLMDIVLGTLIFLALLLPGLVIALLIRLQSRGPALYTSYRVGKNGKRFKMFKFRTMILNDEEEHRQAAEERLRRGEHMGKPENDPRITPIGRFLRKYSIDEFPQIINVLRGEMSLIGPRPCLEYEMKFFEDWHKRRFLVLPGMTGLWQVTGRQMEGLSLHDAMILDVFYAENVTIWLDIKIILKTIPIVLFGRSKG